MFYQRLSKTTLLCTTCQEENWEIFLTSEINNFSQCHVTGGIKTYILEERFIHTSDIVFMPGLFTEATRVQLTAIQHLARIGYTYLGKISESGAVPYDPESNILVDIFAEQFKKLNPAATVSAQSVLSDIQKELDDDDLGQQFYKRLTSCSTLRLIDFEHPENNTYHCTAEFACKNGDESFRPDITLFINGLPLVFIEVKKPNNVGGMVAESKRMNDERFPKKKFRRFINITQLMIFSKRSAFQLLQGRESQARGNRAVSRQLSLSTNSCGSRKESPDGFQCSGLERESGIQDESRYQHAHEPRAYFYGEPGAFALFAQVRHRLLACRKREGRSN